MAAVNLIRLFHLKTFLFAFWIKRFCSNFRKILPASTNN